MRVLYVEDNPTNVFLVKRVAKMGQHEVINFVDGGEALRKYDDIAPDLVLMDVQLSGELSGLDVVRQLRARGIDVPIIAVTAYAMVGDKERCIEAGCTDYLAKPLPVPRLVEIFQEYSDAVEAKANAPVITEEKEETSASEVPVTSSVSTKEETATEATSSDEKVEAQETSATTTETKAEATQSTQSSDNVAEKTETIISETLDEPAAVTDATNTVSKPVVEQSAETTTSESKEKDKTQTTPVDSVSEDTNTKEAETS